MFLWQKLISEGTCPSIFNSSDLFELGGLLFPLQLFIVILTLLKDKVLIKKKTINS